MVNGKSRLNEHVFSGLAIINRERGSRERLSLLNKY